VWAALVVGNVAGIGFNFVTTGGWVFRSVVLARLPRFVAAYLGVYAVNLGSIRLVLPAVGDSIVAQAILTPPLALASYVLMKRWVFAGAAGASG
jgi:putative flippase GtrA